MAEACECGFSKEHISDESFTLKCHDSINGEIKVEIKQVDQFSSQELICKYAKFLKLRKNINLGM